MKNKYGDEIVREYTADLTPLRDELLAELKALRKMLSENKADLEDAERVESEEE